MSKITYNLTTGSEVTASIMSEIKASANALYDIAPTVILKVEQGSTSAPVLTTVLNTSGKTFTSSRNSAGDYSIIPNSAMTGTVVVYLNNPTGTNESRIMAEYSTGLSRVQLKTYDLSASGFADGIMGTLYMKIYQYP